MAIELKKKSGKAQIRNDVKGNGLVLREEVTTAVEGVKCKSPGLQ